MSVFPYVEQDNAYDFYDQSQSFWQSPNTVYGATNGVLNNQASIYFCPSNRKGYWRGDGYWRSRGNYVVNFGNTWDAGGAASAPFAFNANFRFADISDGLSNTLLMSEVIMAFQDEYWDCRGDFHNDDDGSFFSTANTPNSGVDACCICSSYPVVKYPPPCVYTGARFSNNTNASAVSARSRHATGAQAALADGSVRFVSNSINLGTWRAAGSSQGGDLVTWP
jgi:hypothetical protein